MYEKPADSVDEATDDDTSVDEMERAGEEDPQQVATRIEELPASDSAMELEKLSVDRAAEVAAILDPETAGKILARMHASTAAGCICAVLPAKIGRTNTHVLPRHLRVSIDTQRWA